MSLSTNLAEGAQRIADARERAIASLSVWSRWSPSLALAIGFVLRREVLAAGEGTPKMQEIGRAVQEGASAYLNRQFRTLAVFVVIVFVCCSRSRPTTGSSGSAVPSSS